jgi:hypothetical protein
MHEPYTENPNSLRPKKARLVKSKVKSMLIIFFYIRGIVHKEFILTGQIIISGYNCDFLRWLRENVRRLHRERWRQKNWLLHHDNAPYHTSSFTRQFLTKNMTVAPHTPYFSLFPLLKIQLKGRHFETTEVFKAELQAVLNTLIEHDFLGCI